ncbi:AMP-binding protein [Micromonospora chalcea]
MSVTVPGVITSASDVYTPERIAAFKASGQWRDQLIVDFLDRHRRQRPDRTAVVDENGRITWAALADRVDRLAAAFVDAGLRPGEFVAVQMPNRIEFVEIYLAIQRAGLRALTMMSIYREHDVAYMLRTTGARAYIVPDTHRRFDFVAMAQRLRSQAPDLRTVIVLGEAGEGMVPYERFLAERAPAPGAFAHLRPHPDQVSKVSFTSGTTGLPKGVVHTHNTDLSPPTMIAGALGLGPETPIWMPSPIAHATGLLFGVYDSLLCGAKLVLQDQWDPQRALEMISRERATFTVSATPFIGDLVEQDNLSSYDLSSFRYFVSGGARVAPALVERAHSELGCLLLRVFGQSEAPLHTLNFPDDPWGKVTGRDGRPFDGIDVTIVDPADRATPVPVGEVGEYSTAGPHVFLGYYGSPEATAEARDESGRYYSGDLCTVDEDGYVLYVDRMKDIVNRGGVKISALEVENLLAAHPLVQAAAVVAVPDQRLGERACAFVVTRGGAELTLAQISVFLDEMGVTRQKWPERLEVIEALPATPTGKIQKNVLRQRLTADSASSGRA